MTHEAHEARIKNLEDDVEKVGDKLDRVTYLILLAVGEGMITLGGVMI